MKVHRNISFQILSFLPVLLVAGGLIIGQLTTMSSKIETKEPSSHVVLGSVAPEKLYLDPIRLRIPAIGVDTTVEKVTLTSKGEMGTPVNFNNVGWFSLGPRPGEVGSAVIAGHLNTPSGSDGVFADLRNLKQGDKIFIEDSRGNSTTFEVQESLEYHPDFADEVFANKDASQLNLVTCDGSWNTNKQSYTKRLVVFSNLVL